MLEQITEENRSDVESMIQAYEEEFSPFTGKQRNQEGKFELDVDWRSPQHGFYFLKDGIRVGFCVVQEVDGHFDVAEFYVTPAYRRTGVGEEMAHTLFNQFKGFWQVKQLKGLEHAIAFWQKVISRYTHGRYVETELDDAYWGRVVRQRFDSRQTE